MTTMRAILEARAAGDWNAVHEASIGRVYQHMQKLGSKSFGILTSFRGEKSSEQNNRDFHALKKKIRNKGLGFFELRGRWKECQLKDVPYDECPEDNLKWVSEPSLFVPGLSKKDAKDIGIGEYGQDSVIYAGPDTDGKVSFVYPDHEETVGEHGKFTPGCLAFAYSRLKGKPFVFEYVAQNWTERMEEQQFYRSMPGLVEKLRCAVEES